MKISESTKDVLKGAGIVLLGHLLYEGIWALLLFFMEPLFGCKGENCLAVAIISMFCMFFVWFGQFLYVVPLSVYFYRKGKTDIFKGVWIMAGLTFLLCGGICSGILLLQ